MSKDEFEKGVKLINDKMEACRIAALDLVDRFVWQRLPADIKPWPETFDLIEASPITAGRYLQKSLNIGPIMRNAIKCNLCNTVVESKHRHDFASCSCGGCSADGGTMYLRRSFKDDHAYEELSERWPWIENND